MSNILDEEMDYEEIIQDVTDDTIRHINKVKPLYELVKGRSAKGVKAGCLLWALTHNDEFGRILKPELEMVDWAQVTNRI